MISPSACQPWLPDPGSPRYPGTPLLHHVVGHDRALVWDSYDESVEAYKTAWNWLIADPARITSIGTRE